MKAIQINTIITGVRALKDGGVSFSSVTGELTPEEKSAFFELMNINTEMLITPFDEQHTEKIIVDKEAGEKSPSERLKSVIYVYQQSVGNTENEITFYRKSIEKLINFYKKKIDEEKLK